MAKIARFSPMKTDLVGPPTSAQPISTINRTRGTNEAATVDGRVSRLSAHDVCCWSVV